MKRRRIVPRARFRRPRRRRGLLLILVLIVVAFLSLGAYSFTEMMIVNHDAAIQYGRQSAALSFVESGASAVQLFLSQTEQERTDAGGIFDNPDRFQGVVVMDSTDPNDRGCFTVLAPNVDTDGNLSGVRYGLEDESTRLNLNTLLAVEKIVPGAGQTFLMALPGMTEDIAQAILDWLDEDEEPRELGAEIEYYSGLSPPYAPKNGPLETVEELLLVRGVTPQLLFGADTNRNGQLDAHESGADANASDADPAAFRGWSAFLTLHSLEWNVTPEGQPRIYINNNDLTALHEQLSAVFPPEWADYIIAYRQMGPYTGTAASTGSVSIDLALPAKQPLAQVLDLVGTQVRYTQGMNVEVLSSPFGGGLAEMATYMPQLMDYVTVNPSATIPGRINVNQAPATVLNGIPGMTPEIVEQIIANRDLEAATDSRRHETWLLQEGIVTTEEMKTMLPFVTCGGDVYRCQIAGYFQGGAAASRAEIVVDATTPLPRILFWRDISHLGRGYAIETLGVDFTE